MKNFDSYYDPPDDDPICEDGCGEVLVNGGWGWYCGNPFCPTKFQGKEKEMAEALVDALDRVRTLEAGVKRITRQFEQYKEDHLLD